MSPQERASSAGDELSPQESKRRQIFFLIWGLVFMAALIVFRGVLLPFLLAVVVAYVLAPVVRLVEKVKLGARTLPRWVAVVVVYLALLGGLSGFMTIAVPRLFSEVGKLAADVPQLAATATEKWMPAAETWITENLGGINLRPRDEDPVLPGREHIEVVPGADFAGFEVLLPDNGLIIEPHHGGYRVRSASQDQQSGGDLASAARNAITSLSTDTQQHAFTLLRAAQQLIYKIVRGVFMLSILLMVSAFLLISSRRIMQFMRSFSRRPRVFDRLVLRIDKGLSGVVRGQLLIALVNGILSGIGFYFLRPPLLAGADAGRDGV